MLHRPVYSNDYDPAKNGRWAFPSGLEDKYVFKMMVGEVGAQKAAELLGVSLERFHELEDYVIVPYGLYGKFNEALMQIGKLRNQYTDLMSPPAQPDTKPAQSVEDEHDHEYEGAVAGFVGPQDGSDRDVA